MKFPVNRPILFSILLIACTSIYGLLAYVVDRSDFIILSLLYTSLFYLTWKFYNLKKHSSHILFILGLLFRLVLFGAIPFLSQDFYRFIWDGHLLLEGINPYLLTPDELMQRGEVTILQSKVLHDGMGPLSAGNPTNYPPLNQFFFAIAAWLGGAKIFYSILALRTIILAADIGIYFVGRRLLRAMNFDENRIFWYFLNPFIILELTGNLHFEGVMLFFLILGMYFLHQKRWVWSAICLGSSIAVKLIPLMLLPIVFLYLKARKAILYYTLSCGFVVLTFLPFLSNEFFRDYFSSINLWFQSFEFNASFYYLIRWIGYQFVDYNIIRSAGPILGLLVLLLVCWLAMREKNRSFPELITSMLFALTIYLLLATTVHPWYLATPLLLSIFTRYSYVYVWSLLIILSYYTYSLPDFKENMWILLAEYGLVLSVLIHELYDQEPLLPKIQVLIGRKKS